MLQKKYTPYLIVLIFLIPTLFFEYTADDRQWVLSALMSGTGTSGLLDQIVTTISNSTRFFPLHQTLYVVEFYFFNYDNAWLYHLLLLVLNVGAIYTFALWASRVLGESRIVWLVLVLLLATQFRITYNDPIVSYFGMMQIFAMAFFGGLLVLEQYIATARGKYLILWFMLVATQLLIYELAVFLIPVTLFALYEHRKTHLPQVLRCLAGLTVLLVVYLVMYYHFMQFATIEYSGTKASVDVWAIIRTTIFEAFGSMPFSYGAYLASEKLKLPALYIWGLYLPILAIFIYVLTRNVNFKSNGFASRKFNYGLIIWVCAAASISISGRYQEEILPGLTYLVSYLQNFGFALCLLSIINLNSKLTRIAITAAVAATFAMNLLVLNEGLKVDGSKKITLQAVMSNDLLESYHFDQTIFNEKLLQNEELFARKINKNLGVPIYAKLSEIHELKLESASTGMILASSQPYSSSYVLVGKYNPALSRLESVTLMTPSRVRAVELASIYRAIAIKQFASRDKILFGFQLKDSINLPDQLHGVFR